VISEVLEKLNNEQNGFDIMFGLCYAELQVRKIKQNDIILLDPQRS